MPRLLLLTLGFRILDGSCLAAHHVHHLGGPEQLSERLWCHQSSRVGSEHISCRWHWGHVGSTMVLSIQPVPTKQVKIFEHSTFSRHSKEPSAIRATQKHSNECAEHKRTGQLTRPRNTPGPPAAHCRGVPHDIVYRFLVVNSVPRPAPEARAQNRLG